MTISIRIQTKMQEIRFRKVEVGLFFPQKNLEPKLYYKITYKIGPPSSNLLIDQPIVFKSYVNLINTRNVEIHFHVHGIFAKVHCCLVLERV